jgi:thiaminase/transcriptional activator TenA
MFSARLKAIAQPVLADIENHPFVRGIQAGAVPAAALMVYVEQDTCFFRCLRQSLRGRSFQMYY